MVGSSLLRAALVVAAVSCSPSHYVRSADKEVDGILSEYDQKTLGGRESWVQHPRPEEPPPENRIEEEPPAENPPQPEDPLPAEPAGGEEARPTEDADEQRQEQAQVLEESTDDFAEESTSTDAPMEQAEPVVSSLDDATLIPNEEQSAALEPPVEIDLRIALRLAFESNRSFQSRKESLYLQGLSLSLTHYNFGIQYSSAVSFLWSDVEAGPRGLNGNASASIRSPILPTGGTINLGGDYSFSRTQDLNDDVFTEDFTKFYGSSVSIGLDQPLLRGAGYEVSHEGLTQAERGLIYAVRDFELSRQSLSIDTAEQFFQLLGMRKQLRNAELDYEQASFDRKKSEALNEVERASYQDVVLGRRREIDSHNSLIENRESFSQAVDRFKIELGLPTSQELDLLEEDPGFDSVHLDWQSAIEVARHNNLTLITQQQQLEDTERNLRLARNGLLPDANLSLSKTFSGSATSSREAAPDEWSVAAGLTLQIPLQQISERNSYRAALISLDQSRRDFQQQIDELERSVLDQLRELRRLDQQYELKVGEIDEEERNVRVMRIRFEAGLVTNRDLLDATQNLLNSKNELIDLKIEHFTTRLRLMQTLGILFIDENGMWR